MFMHIFVYENGILCLQVTFKTVQQLMEVRRELTPFVRRNSTKSSAAEAYNAFALQERSNTVNLKAGFSLCSKISALQDCI